MGRFADVPDVRDRFEGTIPSERSAWVDTRIDDVENALLGLVPSLEADDSEIGPSRLARVKTLVCDKVLDLYRNPGRVNQQSQASGPYSESTTYASARSSLDAGIAFTAAELKAVRLRSRRSNLGTAVVAPWDARRNVLGCER